MARTYKQPSIVSGLTISDVINMDSDVFNKLSEKNLRKVTGRLVSAANKRLRSFEIAGERSPATRQVEKSGGKFSTRGKNLNELRAEFVRAKGFLEARTSTRKGWNAVKRETMKALKGHGVDVNSNQFDSMWESYEKLKELSPEVQNKNLKYKVLYDITNMMNDKDASPEDIAFELESKLDDIYTQQEELTQDADGVSGFFEM